MDTITVNVTSLIEHLRNMRNPDSSLCIVCDFIGYRSK